MNEFDETEMDNEETDLNDKKESKKINKNQKSEKWEPILYNGDIFEEDIKEEWEPMICDEKNDELIETINGKEIKEEIKLSIKNYFDEFFRNYGTNEKNEIKSIRKIASAFNVSKTWLRNYFLKDYLAEKYGINEIDNIIKELWPSPTESAQLKKKKFRKLISSQLENYPHQIHEILSLNELAEKTGVTRITLKIWIKNSLKRKYGNKEAIEIFNEVWTKRRFTLDTEKRVKYSIIKEFVKKKGGEIITIVKDFDKMNEIPSRRFVDVKCENRHTWNIRISDLIYGNRWCPQCIEHKSEGIMRLFMESIFGGQFPETSLFKACGISKKSGGALRFDGYNSNVKINEKNFKISFEYDGAQHDIFPNSFHESKEQFQAQKQNDQEKVNIAGKYDIVIIRLKKIDGFDIDSSYLFQNEIVKQFLQKTGISIKGIPNYIYNPIQKKLEIKSDKN